MFLIFLHRLLLALASRCLIRCHLHRYVDFVVAVLHLNLMFLVYIIFLSAGVIWTM